MAEKNCSENLIMQDGIVEMYIAKMSDDPNHRFKSWEHCYNAFSGDAKSPDELALHLAFYLASWGMYRGSCGMLWKDYKIHCEAVNIVKRYSDLRGRWYKDADIDSIMNLYEELESYYKAILYLDSNDSQKKHVSATDTLITKIMLGTLGCIPALDSLFKNKFFGYSGKSFNRQALKRIVAFSECNKDIIEQSEKLIKSDLKQIYPPMKIVDMYFWQLGYNEYTEKKRQ